jgi:hypothetical protein
MRNIEKFRAIKAELGDSYNPIELVEWGQKIDALMDEVFIYNPKNKTLTINSSYPYEIDLCRIKSQTALISWTLHLADKTWMPKEFLCEFIERVSEIKGWRCHV